MSLRANQDGFYGGVAPHQGSPFGCSYCSITARVGATAEHYSQAHPQRCLLILTVPIPLAIEQAHLAGPWYWEYLTQHVSHLP